MRAAGRSAEGFTLLEVMVAIAIIGILAALAAPFMVQWRQDLRLKATARSLADLLSVARAEAIRTGDNQAVFFQRDATGTTLPKDNRGIPVIALRLDDKNGNGLIDPGEPIQTVPADSSGTIGWGVSFATTAAPLDLDPNGTFASGWTFVDPTGKPAQWIVFHPDGVPRAFSVTPTYSEGDIGSGAGAVYVSNGRRDYAIILSALGTVRVLPFDVASNAWRQ